MTQIMYRNMDSQQYTLSNALLYLFAKLIGLDKIPSEVKHKKIMRVRFDLFSIILLRLAEVI